MRLQAVGAPHPVQSKLWVVFRCRAIDRHDFRNGWRRSVSSVSSPRPPRCAYCAQELLGVLAQPWIRSTRAFASRTRSSVPLFRNTSPPAANLVRVDLQLRRQSPCSSCPGLPSRTISMHARHAGASSTMLRVVAQDSQPPALFLRKSDFCRHPHRLVTRHRDTEQCNGFQANKHYFIRDTTLDRD